MKAHRCQCWAETRASCRNVSLFMQNDSYTVILALLMVWLDNKTGLIMFLQCKNSSICASNQPPDAQLCHPDVPACVLELVLRRHSGILWALLQTCTGGHTSRQHLCTTWYNTETLTRDSHCMITPSTVETVPIDVGNLWFLWRILCVYQRSHS